MSDSAPNRRGGPPSTLFQPGNAGRPKGSRNALSESFLSALHKDFLQHGETAIEGARAESPLGYCRMVASLLPQKIQVEQIASAVSDEELLNIIRANTIAASVKDNAKLPNVDTTGNA